MLPNVSPAPLSPRPPRSPRTQQISPSSPREQSVPQARSSTLQIPPSLFQLPKEKMGRPSCPPAYPPPAPPGAGLSSPRSESRPRKEGKLATVEKSPRSPRPEGQGGEKKSSSKDKESVAAKSKKSAADQDAKTTALEKKQKRRHSMVGRLENEKPADKPIVTPRKKRSSKRALKESAGPAGAGLAVKRKKEPVPEKSRHPTQSIISQSTGSSPHVDPSKEHEFLMLLDELENMPEFVRDPSAPILTTLPPPGLTSISSAPSFLSTAAQERASLPVTSPRARHPADRQKRKEAGSSQNNPARPVTMHSLPVQPAPKRLPGKKDPGKDRKRLSQPNFYLRSKHEDSQNLSTSATRPSRMAARHSQPTTLDGYDEVRKKLDTQRKLVEKLQSSWASESSRGSNRSLASGQNVSLKTYWVAKRDLLRRFLGDDAFQAIDQVIAQLDESIGQATKPLQMNIAIQQAVDKAQLRPKQQTAIHKAKATRVPSTLGNLADPTVQTGCILITMIAQKLRRSQ